MIKVLFCVFLIVQVLQLTLTKNQKCLELDGVPIKEEFLMGSKFRILSHSPCDKCGKRKHAFAEEDKFDSKEHETACWTMFGMVKHWEFVFNLECTYTKNSDQNCRKSRDGNGPLHKSGRTTILKTDNKTYFAGAMCLFGKENFWFIASSDTSIEEDAEQEALDAIKEIGFDTTLSHTKKVQKVKFLGFGVAKGECNKKNKNFLALL